VEYCLENCRVVASEKLEEALLRHLKRTARAPYRWLKRFRLLFEQKCLIVSADTPADDSVRDPDDMHILQAALAANCAVIITGDKDLLELGCWRGVDIITVTEFLKSLGLR
jgi:putative PIN family toxin of toxin-antitoxin system